MRRKPYLSLVLALVILGGMLALFPTLWMLLLIALIALVSLQVILVRRNLYALPPGHSQMNFGPAADAPASPRAPALEGTVPAVAAELPAGSAAGNGGPAPATARAAQTAQPIQTAPAAPAAPASAAEPARPNLDTELFSRFRKHLEQAEAEATGQAPPRATPPPPEEGEVRDRVELSGAAQRFKTRRPPAPPGAPRAPAGGAPKADAESDGADLFADLRPPPPPTAAPPPQAPQAPAEPPARTGSRRAAKAARRAAAPALERPPADEVSAALAGTAERGAPGLADEALAVLNLAEESAARQDWDGLRAGLDNYVAHLAEAPGLIHWRARQLQVRLAVHDRDINRALQGFEDMLAAGYHPPVDDVPGLLERLLAGAERETAASLRVSMLVRILAGYRQTRDQRAMDRCYGWIEDAQEQVGDERRLLQYLRNHLEIRKVLGDVPGQLELIDQLGNRCFRLGLTDEAKAYYEMGLRLRADTEQAPAPDGAVREG
jgi:hypothetical protein